MLLRYVFPDFLPNPDMMFRDKLAEKLQRHDMLRRRTTVEIPEFYVGMYALCSLALLIHKYLFSVGIQ